MSPIARMFHSPGLSVSGREWNILVALLWIVILIVGFVGNVLPTSNWFDVKSVEVFDTTAGVPPLMEVDRDITQPFVADWLVEVERRGTSGYYLQCSARGQSAYRTDAELPRPLTLDWWTYPVICNLQPGTYRVETTWELDLGFAGKRTVRVLSNPFVVKAHA